MMNAARTLCAFCMIANAAPLAAADPIAAHRVPCLIEPAETVELMSPIDGVIDHYEIERGDRVRRGQVVAVLEDSVEREDLGVAQSEVRRAEMEVELRSVNAEYARRTADRIAGLHAGANASEQELEQAQTEAAVAGMELERARAGAEVARSHAARAAAVLARRVLRSPIDGVVTRRPLAAGEAVDDRAVAVIQQVDVLHVETLLPLQLFRTVRVGEPTRIRIGPPVDRIIEGTIGIVDPVVDPASETFGVRVIIEPAQDGAAPGLGCHAVDLERIEPGHDARSAAETHQTDTINPPFRPSGQEFSR